MAISTKSRQFGQRNVWPSNSPSSLAAHHCQLYCVGHNDERDARLYRIDNRTFQGRMCIFQYTYAGEGWFRDDAQGNTRRIRPGEAFVALAPSATRWWLQEGQHWEFLWTHIGGDAVHYHIGELIRMHGPVFPLAADSKPLRAIESFYEVYTDHGSLDSYTVSARLYSFLMELYRVNEAHRTGPAAIPEELEAARRYIEEHFADGDLNVEGMAKAAGCSRYHFSRRFADCFHAPPYEYLLRIRLDNAARLLLSTNSKIADVAARTGFRDAAYFRKAFRRRMGVTPSNYRRQRGRPLSVSMPDETGRMGRGGV